MRLLPLFFTLMRARRRARTALFIAALCGSGAAVGSSTTLAVMALNALGAGSIVKAAQAQGLVPATPPKSSIAVSGNEPWHAQASAGSFDACREQFAQGRQPRLQGLDSRTASGLRPLCFDGFAVMYSSQHKTPLYVAQVLDRQRLAAAKQQQRSDQFFEDARLPRAARATLEDYRGSGFDRGHMAPAGDMGDERSMAQSFSLANIVPQAREHNRKPWADVEKATRSYVLRASGPVYVITGVVHEAGQCPIAAQPQPPRTFDAQACTIGAGKVAVPSHMFKLVFDPQRNRAWAHWLPNRDDARVSPPIAYAELVRRTGIDFLPGFDGQP